MSAIVARGFASLKSAGTADEIFLAALLQDLGVLAIDRVQPKLYAALPKQASHQDIVACEIRSLEADHAALGGWLLRHWQLPERLCAMVEASHAPTQFAETTLVGAAARCLALGAECAELLLFKGSEEAGILDFCRRCVAWLGVEVDRVQITLESIVKSIPEVEELFDLSLVGSDVAASLLVQASELLSSRRQRVRDPVDTLESETARDALTGLLTRRHFDEAAQKEFRNASAGHWPLSVVIADLDRFRAINDAHGRAVGDLMLQSTARVLLNMMRDTDMAARFDGGKFIILLPGTTSDGAQIVCQRLLARLRAAEHVVGPVTLRATASLGLATHSAGTSFASVEELVEAAALCVQSAKKSGCDRLVIHGLAV